MINAGVYAYEPCQELMLFEARVLKYNADLVFVIYTGELSENRNFCRLDGETLQYINLTYGRTQYVIRYALGYLKAKSHLLNYLYRLYRYQFGGSVLLPEQLNRTFTYEPPDERISSSPPGRGARSMENYIRIPEEKVLENLPMSYNHRLLYAIFKKFNRLVKSYGGKLYIVFSHGGQEDFPLGHYAEKEGIGYISVFRYLNDRKTKEVLLKLDGHWNEYGHFLVGRSFFELIREKHLSNRY